MKKPTKFGKFYYSLWALLLGEISIILLSFAIIVFFSITPWAIPIGDFFTKIIILFGIIGVFNFIWLFFTSIIALFTSLEK